MDSMGRVDPAQMGGWVVGKQAEVSRSTDTRTQTDKQTDRQLNSRQTIGETKGPEDRQAQARHRHRTETGGSVTTDTKPVSSTT